MNLFQTIRNRAFWAKDALNKNAIKSNIRDIKTILEDYSSLQSRVRREQLLKELLTHASKTTPFYQKNKRYKSLEDFPVVNKNIIRNDYSAFRSESFTEEETFQVTTSGSTGTPFMAYQDKRKKQRNTADTIYFANKANFKVGEQLIYMRKWSKQFKKSGLLSFLQNIRMVNVVDFSDKYCENLIRSMEKDKSPKAILGYVSALTQLCQYLDKIQSPPLECNVTSIIAIAESLNDYCKESLEKYFQVPVVSRYSNMENGIFAQQDAHSGSDFNINWASYVVEILDEEEDVPVKNGTVGRIVVTDLFNYAMPLIRYDTGDLGVMEINSSGVPVLKQVQGRKLDMIYDTRGRMVSPTIVWELKHYENVRQFQLIQEEEKAYTIRLSLDGEMNHDQEIIENYKNHLGQDAVITIEKTNEIPVLASGKRRLVVNNYKQQAPARLVA